MTARQPFRNILVDVDPTSPTHPALDQAVDLASRCGATLTLVHVLPVVPAGAWRYLPPGSETDLVAERQVLLDRIAESRAGTGLSIRSKVLRGSAAIALIQEVLTAGHDLVIRSHGRQRKGAFPPFGTTDLQILRKCPVPVWLVGPDVRGRPRKVLAAVHANPDDRVETDLNIAIIELGLLIADLEHGGLTILQAWSAWGEELIAPRITAAEFSDVIETARRAASDDLRLVTSTFGPRLERCKVELVKGQPDEVITEYANDHAVDLVVMGSVARTGVTGWIMGNTAERVLRQLRCSVLTVKPARFVSPVSRP
jgi:nucleotide-binding universal stress UspA family protein